MTPIPAFRHRSHPSAVAVVAWGLMALWALAWLAGPTLLSMAGLALNPHGHADLYAHGHPFVDARSWWGVPNTLDVLSNLPLVLAGAAGFWTLRGRMLTQSAANALRVFFAGLILSGLGSASYHWAPDAGSLVIDHLGMSVAFAGLLALSVAERVGMRESRGFLPVVLVLALVSAALPHLQGNVQPWAVVQFGGMGLVVWAAMRPPVAGAVGVPLAGVIGCMCWPNCWSWATKPCSTPWANGSRVTASGMWLRLALRCRYWGV
ncbi:MAG: hypothetical protein Q8M80_01525 [Hydrogenophaga sp.]|uniref:hypothetical protein n=1 Tax=Hydrogenophaga sp. TaxID=1904254 RepID=UPI0027338F15|nr:hypothetical protein [Hydrogenophaga sp.]MDP2985155.1 hypothetical protein [Hydrogenophaga sp.]MDP3202728.1 hypothetical protein [Hydrogenophaga sp.]MDP3628655.1 hypothetical protein [Hydrogenophaga sp.]